jgi:hypothetical protein
MSKLKIHSQKLEKVTSGQIRQVRRVKDRRHVFSSQELLPLLYISEQPRQKICGGLLHVPSPPLQFTGVFHTEGLTCQ